LKLQVLAVRLATNHLYPDAEAIRTSPVSRSSYWESPRKKVARLWRIAGELAQPGQVRFREYCRTPGAPRASYLGNVREGRHFGLRPRQFAAGADLQRRRPRTIMLDMASNESLTYGEHEGSAYYGRFRYLLSPLWSVRPVR
jgi:hypothetical protein